MPRGWSMEICSLMVRCIERCRKVGAAALDVVDRGQRGVQVVELGVVLGVLGDPVGGDALHRRQGACSRRLRCVSQKKRRTSFWEGANIANCRLMTAWNAWSEWPLILIRPSGPWPCRRC